MKSVNCVDWTEPYEGDQWGQGKDHRERLWSSRLETTINEAKWSYDEDVERSWDFNQRQKQFLTPSLYL